MSLEIRNLEKSYDDKKVVNGVTFSLNEPGVYALLGRNGAGKTTTIRMVLGMLAKDGGEVLWNGRPIEENRPKTGYLAEERGLYPKYPLIDQLYYFASLKGLKREEATKEIRYWADRLAFGEYLYPDGEPDKKRVADQLSKGNQQKIQFAAALLGNPELLVLDEPLSGLDPVNADLFKSVITEQVKKGKYIIMSSHQMDLIEEFCENITILHRGDTVLQGNLQQIKQSLGLHRLWVKCDQPIADTARAVGLAVISEKQDKCVVDVPDEAAAQAFLKKLLAAGREVYRFELKTPTLHELFVEKAGDEHDD